MKVALVITGHMRCWKQLFPYFKHKYILPYDPDIYISTWNTEGWWKWGSFYEQSPSINVDEIIEAYKPVDINIEDFNSYKDSFESRSKYFTNTIGYPVNAISMIYKWYDGIRLIKDDYDLVIRLRTDVEYLDPLPDFDPDKFYAPHHPGLNQGGLGDMLHASSYDKMKTFGDLYINLEYVYNQTNMLCPHLITQKYIEMNNFDLVEFKCNYNLHNTPFGRHQDVTKFIK